MEETYSEMLLEVAKLLQKRYGHMAEVSRLTEEIATELQHDDRVNVQMMLSMRAEEIDALRENDRHLHLFQESAPLQLQGWLREALNGKLEPREGDSVERVRILRLAKSVRSAWEKTMLVDRRMNTRLAGNDSFYANR